MYIYSNNWDELNGRSTFYLSYTDEPSKNRKAAVAILMVYYVPYFLKVEQSVDREELPQAICNPHCRSNNNLWKLIPLSLDTIGYGKYFQKGTGRSTCCSRIVNDFLIS